jgi:hypothetical protein
MSNRICINCGWALDFKQKIGKVFCLPKIFKKYYRQDWHTTHCIPRNETVQPCSQVLHSCICELFIYSQDRSAYLDAAK